MKAFHESDTQDATQKNESVSEVVPPVRRHIPPPGKPLSFEEAKKLTFQKYDNALRELAK